MTAQSERYFDLENNTPENKPNDGAREASAMIVRIGSVLIAVAIVLACFSYTKVAPGAGQVAMYILAGTLALIGGFLIFVIAYGTHLEKQKRNFFLYDKKLKKDIPLDELTVARVRERLVMHMALFKHKGKLYVGDLFDSKTLIVPEVIKPLFCYELLCEIDDENGANASVFLSFGAECSDIFSKYLGSNDDHELALKIKGYFFAYAENREIAEEFRKYIISEKAHIEEKMLGYAVDNIEKFD